MNRDAQLTSIAEGSTGIRMLPELQVTSCNSSELIAAGKSMISDSDSDKACN